MVLSGAFTFYTALYVSFGLHTVFDVLHVLIFMCCKGLYMYICDNVYICIYTIMYIMYCKSYI